MRRWVAGVSALVALAACGSSSSGSSKANADGATRYAIEQIEVNWHKASSTKDIDLMMSLWADNATFTVGSKTYTGKDQIRGFFVNDAAPFQAGNDWVSETPAFKSRVTVDGNSGTLYFECVYLDVHTQKVTAIVSADQNVERVGGQWLIINSTAATPDNLNPY